MFTQDPNAVPRDKAKTKLAELIAKQEIVHRFTQILTIREFFDSLLLKAVFMNSLSKFLVTLSLSLASLLSASAAVEIVNVPPAEFLELVERNDGIILDVRTPEEVAQGHIAGASVLNFYDKDFERKLNLMQKDKPIYVYCRSGGRSSKAAQMMSRNGFASVYNLTGGIGAWNQAKLPLEKSKNVPTKKIQPLSTRDFEKQLAVNSVALVDFQTQWCAPCKQMAPIVDALEKEFAKQASILRVDLDSSPDLGAAYDVKGVPVFVLFVDGKERWRHSGLIEADALRTVVANAL